MAEVNTVTYFCPDLCEDLEPEQARDTGEQYFGPVDDEYGQFNRKSQATEQQRETAAKPEPGTVYSIPESCVSGSDTWLSSF